MTINLVECDAGSGGAKIPTSNFTQGADTVRVPISMIYFGAIDTAGVVVSASNPLPVVQTGALPAGTNVIGHVICDTGSTTAVTGTVACTQSGTWNVTNISGTVSLPTGAATSAKQDTGNTSLSSIDGKLPALGQALAAASVPVILPSATITTLTPPAAITGFGTAANQTTIIASLSSIDGHVDGVEGALTSIDAKMTACNTGAVVVASSALPTGAATAARQDTGNSSLTSIDAKIPALGQALAAASVPVILPAATITTLTPPAAITGFATAANQTTELSSLASIDGKITAVNTGAVTISTALPAGDNNVGNVDIVTVPTDPFGANADAASATGSISAKLRFIAATGIPITNTVTVASHAVTIDVGAVTSLALIDDVIFVDDAAFTPGTSKVAAIGLQADEVSTDSVDEGDVGCPRMTLDRKAIVTSQVHTSGGEDSYSFLSTAAVQAAEIKSSAGQVYGIEFFNKSASIAYVRLYNMTGIPGTGDAANIVWRGMIPANTSASGFVKAWPNGKKFTTGIGIRVSLAVADNDSTVLGANDVMGNVGYK